MLGDAGVGGPTSIRAGGSRLRLERGDPVRDALVVDSRDRRGVLHRGQTDHQVAHTDRGVSQQNSAVAEPAPSSWAMMNAGASAGRIPANVSVADRARVTAGFANDVEAVNQ